MVKYIVKVSMLLALFSKGNAQKLREFSMAEMISLAQTKSSSYQLAETQLEARKYDFLIFKSDLKPQISLYGNVPTYSKLFTPVTQPNGSIAFLPVKQNLNNLGISLSQSIPYTGAMLSLNTELNQFYDFQSKFNQYNGTPFFLKLNQPIFGFNELKWRKKIEPLKLTEAKRNYVQAIENIAQQVVKEYFDMLDTEIDISIAENNLINDKANYEIEKKRVNLGTTTEDKLLQLELQALKSRQDLAKAKYDYKIAELALRTYIGYREVNSFRLLIPDQIPDLSVEISQAVKFAKDNRPEYIAFERKRLESESDVSQAKAAKQQITITATYGLNRAAEDLSTIYTNPKNQQTFAIGFNVPIIDWGRRTARYKSAKSLQKLTSFNISLDSETIIHEIAILVENIDLLKNNIILNKITDSVAARRFTIANSLFQIGKLTITEINQAQNEKDNAKRKYISVLRDYWNSFYLLRRLTMYDFAEKKSLNN